MTLVFLVDFTGGDLTGVVSCLRDYYLVVADFSGVFFEADRSLVGVLDDISS